MGANPDKVKIKPPRYSEKNDLAVLCCSGIIIAEIRKE
jgi:hypothetical protein